MDSTIVIKVKHEETLRRFNARITGGELDLNIDALREKIIGLFKFTPDSELLLTYVDEDSDIVTLADDEDLGDVVRQALNPLRITVKLCNKKSGRSSARTSGNSTPLRSPRVQQSPLNSNVLLKSVPEPIRQTITKICTDVASRGSSSGQTLADLVQCLSEMGLPYLNQLSDLRAGAIISVPGGASECSTDITASHDAESSKVDGAAFDVLPSVGSENQSSKGKEVLPNVELKRSEPKNDMENSGNANGDVKALASSQVPGLEALKAALEDANPKRPDTVQIDVNKKKEVDCQSDENISNGKVVEVVNLSSSSIPPVPNAAAGDNNEVSDKPNESTRTKSISAHAFPSYHPNAMCSKQNSQIKDSMGGPKNAFLGNASGINIVPGPRSECPFTAVPLGNSPAVAPHLAPNVVRPSRNLGFSDGPGIAFHRGVRCDGCRVHPITGPRFKSKVKDDYDLCSICFAQMGNENDYVRIDRPVANWHPYFKDAYDFHNQMHPPSQPPVLRCGGVKPGQPKFDSRFIQDVNILDGTIMAPSTPFTKIWRMRNNGSVVWPLGTNLVWVGGDKLGDLFSVQLEIASAGIPVDQDLDIAVDFVAPDPPGQYISYWRMASPSGQKFGQHVWVFIQVDASLKELQHEGFCGFNLNLPPVSNGISGPEIINVNPEPMVEDSLPEVDNSNGAMKVVEPLVDASTEREQELNFPINDTLLVGGGAVSNPVPSAEAAPSPSGSCPIIDLSEIASPLPGPLPSPATVVQTSALDVKEAAHGEDSCFKYLKEQEETLLKDLEEMGFKQVDLNKEILRLNEYDLEKSVEDLCDLDIMTKSPGTSDCMV